VDRDGGRLLLGVGAGRAGAEAAPEPLSRREAANTTSGGGRCPPPLGCRGYASETGWRAELANPTGAIAVITDNLSSHSSVSTRTWLAAHPRIRQVFIPVGACWLHLQEGWWRLFRRAALAGQAFACPDEITLATEMATCQLNARARPWVWGRPAPSPRYRRRVLTYRI